MRKKIKVMQGEMSLYDIILEREYDTLLEYLAPFHLENRTICIVTDSNVEPYYKEPLTRILSDRARGFTTFTFPAGEENKNLDVVQNLYEHLIKQKFDRKDMLIALGGGVVGDLTGYAAATYLRGISFIQMPTTLLSMVDSSIGGKTGVDFQTYKNMVGAFHQPSFVYMAFHTLKTLDERQFSSGMAEIIKHGLILNTSYYQWLEEEKEKIKSRDLDTIMKMVEISCNIKREVVEKDPKEQCERALLNFGHTIGHSIETLAGFRLFHGECVAIGIVAASYLSYLRGYLSGAELQGIEETLALFGLPVFVSKEYQILALHQMQTDTTDEDAFVNCVVEETKHDKKMEAGQIKFILLQEIGKAVIDTSVTDSEMWQAIFYISKPRMKKH